MSWIAINTRCTLLKWLSTHSTLSIFSIFVSEASQFASLTRWNSSLRVESMVAPNPVNLVQHPLETIVRCLLLRQPSGCALQRFE